MMATIHCTLTGPSRSSIKDIYSKIGFERSRCDCRPLELPIPICSHFSGVKSLSSITVYNNEQLTGRNRRWPIHWMLTGSSLTSMGDIYSRIGSSLVSSSSLLIELLSMTWVI